LLYAGKGLLTLSQYLQEGFLTNKVGMAGLLIVFTLMTNIEEFVVKNNHYMLSYLSLAFNSKYLFVLDENLKEMDINLRVGQALDVVGQVGKPRQVTGFQTHTAPVIVSQGERAELGTEEFISFPGIVHEDIIIVKKNPNYQEEEPKRA